MSAFKFASLLARCRARQISRVGIAIAKNEISRYPKSVTDFERSFADYVGQKFGLSFCNGTSAIEAALFAAGVGPGDEVIVPSFTFHASIDPIVNCGARPVFVDVNERTLTLSPEDVARNLSERTKAVMIVHLFGMPADIRGLNSALADRDISIIEDTSHAHGASYDGRMCGALGDLGVFSLQGDKSVAGGEGGIVVTDDESAFLKMSMWGHFDRHGSYFAKIGAEEFSRTGIGFKRRMAPISVILASEDLRILNGKNDIFRANIGILDNELGELENLTLLSAPDLGVRGGLYTGYPLLVNDGPGAAAETIKRLRRKGIRAIGCPYAMHHKMAIYNSLPQRNRLLGRGPTIGEWEEAAACLPTTESLPDRLVLLSVRYLAWLKPKVLKTLLTVLRR